MAEHRGTRSTKKLTTLDAFLDEEAIREEVTLHASSACWPCSSKRAMRERTLSKSAMAALMDTSRAQLARILAPRV